MAKSKSPVIVVDKDVLNSKAFSSLRKGSTIIVYIDFLQKRKLFDAKTKRGKKRWVIVNNGEIEYTYSEAKKKRGFTKPRFHAAIKELVEKGLIDITHAGGGYDGDKSLYAISDRWKKYGTPEFESVTMQKDTRQARGFSTVHERNKQKDTSKPKTKSKLVRRK
jgi:hypothetical protein